MTSAFAALALYCLGPASSQAAAVPADLQAALAATALTEPAAVIVRRRGPAVVVRPGVVAPRVVAPRVVVRPWVRRPHYGLLIGGIVLGTIVAATAVGVVPVAPSPDVCWYWVDPTRTPRLLGLLPGRADPVLSRLGLRGSPSTGSPRRFSNLQEVTGNTKDSHAGPCRNCV